MTNLQKNIKKDKLSEGYYNIMYKDNTYLERNLNGSFTIQDKKGNKETYYGYSRRDALNKFKRERKLRGNKND